MSCATGGGESYRADSRGADAPRSQEGTARGAMAGPRRDGLGRVGDAELAEYASKLDSMQWLPLGAACVCIQGLVRRAGAGGGEQQQPHAGINGEYARSEQACNGRAVYFKVGELDTALWWVNVQGQMAWCVGSRQNMGSKHMQAYVESLGAGPEEAGSRAWSVFSYDCQSWQQQTGGSVVARARDAPRCRQRAAALGSERVCVSCAEKADGTPYAGLNGEYARSDETANSRALYVKVTKPTTAMWLYTEDRQEGPGAKGQAVSQWVIGPKDKAGSKTMWAYTAGSGAGPDDCRGPWYVYCYASKAWKAQACLRVTGSCMQIE